MSVRTFANFGVVSSPYTLQSFGTHRIAVWRRSPSNFPVSGTFGLGVIHQALDGDLQDIDFVFDASQ